MAIPGDVTIAPTVLRAWTAKRSGAFITLYGLDERGNELTIACIEHINGPSPVDDGIVARDIAGRYYLLT